MKHRHALREVFGYDPGPEVAVLDYATQFGRRTLLDAVGTAAETLVGGARGVFAPASQAPSLELLDFVDWAKTEHLCNGMPIRLSNDADYARLRDHIL